MKIPGSFVSWSTRYEIRTRNRASEDRPKTSSSDTPSTYRPNPHYERSKVVTAVGFNRFTDKQLDKIFGLKIAPYGQHQLLENETEALKRAYKSGIAQNFVESFISQNGFYVLVFDWLTNDGANSWKSVNEIINQEKKPLSEIWTHKDNQKFFTALVNNVNRLHRVGIVHGDIKDSHIFVNLNNKEDIRLIDFGLAQFKSRRALWRGGSHGFSPPQYWKSYDKPHPLTWSDLLKIDNYCLASTLFYAYTLQIYPLANPNLSEILDNQNMFNDSGFREYENEVTKIYREDSLESISNKEIRFLFQQGLDYKKIPLNTTDMLLRGLLPRIELSPVKRLFKEFFK